MVTPFKYVAIYSIYLIKNYIKIDSTYTIISGFKKYAEKPFIRAKRAID